MKGHRFQNGLCECGELFPATSPVVSFEPTDVLIARIRRETLEEVLNQIDEERNICAYGACGCADAVKTLRDQEKA